MCSGKYGLSEKWTMFSKIFQPYFYTFSDGAAIESPETTNYKEEREYKHK